ncbi:MAG: AAA family ATPase [Pseudomonadota bacterium]
MSWVLVAGDVACKIKKAVRFDFADFSTLDARQFYCQEELRLNRRLAPDLYLDVVPITGSPEHPRLDGPGPPLEYAVRMRSFPQQSLWRHRISSGSISEQEMDALAGKLADFHQHAAIASEKSGWGTSHAIRKIAEDNLAELDALTNSPSEKKQLRDVRAWMDMHQQNLDVIFDHRKTQGSIRECHGDLHGGNIFTHNDQVEIFDCIEFNESLRWIDVMNDIAFICMDLESHGRHDLASRLLSHYLEITGDHEGLAVLRYFQIQRALVRSKVALLRARQLAQEASTQEEEAARYLAFPARVIRPAPAAILITHGYAGSGKSTFSKCLAGLAGAIRIRSDVERKRLHGMAATSRALAAPDRGLYDAAATRKTYDRLLVLARHVLNAGMPVIVDAAFLRKEQRARFQELAHELGLPFFIFDVLATESAMKRRLAARAQQENEPSDAGLQVLAHQQARHDVLAEEEKANVIVIDSETGMDREDIRNRCEPVLSVLRQRTL